jgi:hypothetical protein
VSIDAVDPAEKFPAGKPCPKCGGELTFGYGLMGGGCGPYELCMEDGCDYFYKQQDEDES